MDLLFIKNILFLLIKIDRFQPLQKIHISIKLFIQIIILTVTLILFKILFQWAFLFQF
jgi:hypothetical protein